MANDHADQFYWTMTADLLSSYDAGTINEDDLMAALRRIPHPVAKNVLREMFHGTDAFEQFYREYIAIFLANFSVLYGDRVSPVILNRVQFHHRIVA